MSGFEKNRFIFLSMILIKHIYSDIENNSLVMNPIEARNVYGSYFLYLLTLKLSNKSSGLGVLTLDCSVGGQ